MNGTPRAAAAWPSTQESPTTKTAPRSGQRSPMTRSPSGAGFRGRAAPRRTARARGGGRPQESVLGDRGLLAREANQRGSRPAGVPRRERHALLSKKHEEVGGHRAEIERRADKRVVQVEDDRARRGRPGAADGGA